MPSGFNSARSRRQTNRESSVASATAITQQMQSYFSEIEDPRVQRTRAHRLTDILSIGILAVIAGGKGWEDMENYGLSKLDWLGEFLALIQRAGVLAGLPFPVHPHMLRHTCGFYLASSGHDTRAIQAYLGHKNIQHTVRYTELAPGRFKDFWSD
jgi:hypothetical protein